MKKIEIEKLINKSVEELTKDVLEAKEKLWELKRDIASGKVKNHQSGSELRRNIARMLTVVHNKATQVNK